MMFRNKKTFIFIIIFIIYSLLFTIYFPSPVLAARKRTRKVIKPKANPQASQAVNAQIRFRPDRLGLLINFSNFTYLESGRYQLIYESNGVTQGAGGTIIPGETSTKELLFGTCSGGVCNWHENISNARLSIYSTLKNGVTILKPYRIKV